jgi:hypothetical protein
MRCCENNDNQIIQLTYIDIKTEVHDRVPSAKSNCAILILLSRDSRENQLCVWNQVTETNTFLEKPEARVMCVTPVTVIRFLVWYDILIITTVRLKSQIPICDKHVIFDSVTQ